MKRCFCCMKEYREDLGICPYCGNEYDTTPNQPIDLPPGTKLNNRFVIGKSTGSGGFGIIYKAYDTQFDTVVAVKEFYPGRIITRAEGTLNVIVSRKASDEYIYRKRRFLAEARTMAQFIGNQNIPNVYEFFEANNTAYIVMEFLYGQTLAHFLQEQGKCSTEMAIDITKKVGSALSALHKEGILHKDVAPDNIFLCDNGTVKLLDFGAAKLKDFVEEIIDIILKPGYSPPEQYDGGDQNIGWWSDVYSLGATTYAMLTGIKPDEATNRKVEDTVAYPHTFDPSIPENLSNSVMKAMAIDVHMRFSTVDEYLRAIGGEIKVISVEKERKKRKFRRFSGIAAAILVLVVCSFIFAVRYFDKKDQVVLNSAEIEMWVAVRDGSTEGDAVQSIVNEFQEAYPDVKVNVKLIPQQNYESALETAAADENLPALFESTDVSDTVLTDAEDLGWVLGSEQAHSCLFLDQYNNYYKDKKRIPLGIEVPVAYVITSGHTSAPYTENFFRELSDFGTDIIAVRKDYSDLINKNFDTASINNSDEGSFLDDTKNTCAVMLSSTMDLNSVRNTIKSYSRKCVFPDKDRINCDFTYEWSVGNGNFDQKKAAEMLLSWMLGNAYQNELMISRCNDGQIPINSTCFDSKISQKNLTPIKDIYHKFVFDNNNG